MGAVFFRLFAVSYFASLLTLPYPDAHFHPWVDQGIFDYQYLHRALFMATNSHEEKQFALPLLNVILGAVSYKRCDDVLEWIPLLIDTASNATDYQISTTCVSILSMIAMHSYRDDGCDAALMGEDNGKRLFTICYRLGPDGTWSV